MTTPDEVKRLADDYAHCYSFVGDDTMPRRKAELYAAIDALAAQAAPAAQPVAWRIRETNPEYPEPCPWHYREQSERPYCSWKYHEMQPLYASPQAATTELQDRKLLALTARLDEAERVIRSAASVMRGDGVEDQGEAYDMALRLLDAHISVITGPMADTQEKPE